MAAMVAIRARAELGPVPDRPDLWFAGRPVGADLWALLTETAAAVDRWRPARPQEQVGSFSHRAPSRHLLVTRPVAEVESDLGRRAATFHLQISVLPVQGAWRAQAPADHVLVSRERHGDQATFRGFLAPVIASLA
jgi:hypothetical protein